MTTNDTILAALAEFAADLATDLQNLSAKAAAFSQRLQAVETEPEAAPALTLEDGRASLAAVVKNGGSAKVRDALADMGVSKLSDLAPERFSELLEAVNA